tara:strand:- start:3868 stop:5664 length:1797 start_codon:yes stop_codon:yes gene_type:complete
MNLFKRIPFFGLTPVRILNFMLLSTVTAFFEGFGMTMLLPVLEYIENDREVTTLLQGGGMWPKIISGFDFIGLELNLFSLLTISMTIMLMRVLTMYVRQIYTAWLSQEVLHTTRSRLYETYMSMDYATYAKLSSGGIINLLTTETQRAGASFNALFGVISNTAVLIGFLLVMLWLSVPLTLFSFLFFGCASALVAFYLRHTRKYSVNTTDANSRYSRMVLERLGAFRLVKLTATGKRESEKVYKVSSELRNLMYRLSKITSRVDLIMEPIALMAGCGILYISFNIFSMGISEVGIFGLILIRMLPIAKETMKSRQSFYACSGSLSAVISGYDMASAAREKNVGTKNFGPLKKGIRLENVTFSYEKINSPVLSDINLNIPAGKITALVGPSGAGKSTLADVVARLYLPQKGSISYDDFEGADYNLSLLRRGVAFVSQDAAILNDSVAENVRFANYKATNEEIWIALKQAKASEFVESLTNRLGTTLGERGIKLSGGQKQRLSLARALLQKAGLLILDEPTSALDSETEQDFKEVIDELRNRGETTIIIIAHRFSTIVNADKIVVLENGRIIEEGSHDELVLSEKWYARVSGIQAIENKQ